MLSPASAAASKTMLARWPASGHWSLWWEPGGLHSHCQTVNLWVNSQWM